MREFLTGFRKFIVVILAFILLTTFLITGHIPGVAYASAMGVICVGFFASNTGEHIVNMGKEWIKALKKDK